MTTVDAFLTNCRARVQIVAFPQSGVMRCPGILDLLDAAVRNGADLVGGIDPLEIDRDPKGQLDGIYAIAARHGVGLDIHLHEPGEMGLFNVQEICARTRPSVSAARRDLVAGPGGTLRLNAGDVHPPPDSNGPRRQTRGEGLPGAGLHFQP